MGTKFADFMSQLQDEARAEGSEAVGQLEALRDHFRMARGFASAAPRQQRRKAPTQR